MLIRFLLITLCTINLSTIVLQAQESFSENALLWKIEGNDLEEPSYLFGTIHLICQDDYFMTEEVESAFKSTDQLVLELDMDDPAMMLKVQKLSMNDSLKNFSSQISENQLEVLNAYFMENYGADLSQLGVMKPFTLLSMMYMKSISCDLPQSYEMNFVEMAKKHGLEVVGLESIEFQTAIFDKAPLEEQVSWLMEFAQDEEAKMKENELLVAAYKAQDINELHAQVINSPEFSELTEELLYNRNEDWVQKVADFASEKPTFFAVGAGHLGSERGLIRLLIKEGYSLTPVN